MNNAQFKAARVALGLSVNQLATILDVNARTIRKWESEPGHSNARDPNPIACQVLRWLESGQLILGK